MDQASRNSTSGDASYLFIVSSFFMFIVAVLMSLEANNWLIAIIFSITKVVVLLMVFLRNRGKMVEAASHVLVGSYFIFLALSLLLGAQMTALVFAVILVAITFADLDRNVAVVWSVFIVLFMVIYQLMFVVDFETLTRDNMYIIGAVMAGALTLVVMLYDIDYTGGIFRAYESAQQSREVATLRHSKDVSLTIDAQYGVVLNSIVDGIIVTDETGRIKIVNKAALEILGESRSNLVGNPVGGVIGIRIDHEDVAQADHPANQVIRSQQPLIFNQSSRKRISMIRADKSDFYAALSVSPVVVEESTKGVVLLFRDMTEIDRIDKAKSEFVSLASHQLRTPLNIVSWYIEKLMSQKKGLLNLKQLEYANQIFQNNKRMILLVGDLLNASRVDLGKVNVKKEEVNLLLLADQLAREIKIAMEQKNITFATDFPSNEIIFQDGDVNITTVIIQNLLSNALKYTDKGGKVDFQIKIIPSGERLNPVREFITTKEGVLISVADNGVGIPEEEQKKIFGKLFRAENIKDRDVEGSGLGLYVTQSFAQALKGDIWFESEQGKGTIFFVYLPFPRPMIKKGRQGAEETLVVDPATGQMSMRQEEGQPHE